MTNLDIISYEGRVGGSYGHSYFLSNPAVSSDIIALVQYGLAPRKENGRPLEKMEGIFGASMMLILCIIVTAHRVYNSLIYLNSNQ